FSGDADPNGPKGDEMSARVAYLAALAAVGFAGVAVACGAGSTGAATPAATTPPIVTAPSSSDAHEAWLKFAACMSRRVGLRVVVMPPPHYGIRITLPAGSHP